MRQAREGRGQGERARGGRCYANGKKRRAAAKRGKGVKQWERVIREQRRETLKRSKVLEMVSEEGSEFGAARGWNSQDELLRVAVLCRRLTNRKRERRH